MDVRQAYCIEDFEWEMCKNIARFVELCPLLRFYFPQIAIQLSPCNATSAEHHLSLTTTGILCCCRQDMKNGNVNLMRQYADAAFAKKTEGSNEASVPK